MTLPAQPNPDESSQLTNHVHLVRSNPEMNDYSQFGGTRFWGYFSRFSFVLRLGL